MRKREIAALLATVIFCWPAGDSRLLARPLTAPSSSSIGVQLAQKGSVGRGYATDEPAEGSVDGPVMVYGDGAVCSGKAAGEPCSFTGPDGQTVNGTCATLGNQLACVLAGAMGGYGTGQPGPPREGTR
jgi:hypothetical protein